MSGRSPGRSTRPPADSCLSRPLRPSTEPADLTPARTVLPSTGMSYPFDNALYQWEEGARRLRELAEADPRAGRRLYRAVDAVRDELRRRIGATFTAAELADLYGSGTDW